MENHQQSSPARLAAIIALIATAIVLLVIVVGSLSGGGGSGGGSSARNVGAENGKSAAQKQSQRKIYVVKPGDCCLSEIADKTGIDVDKLVQLNPHLDPQAIHSGDRVKLR